MRWAVAAPFFEPGQANRWLLDAVPAGERFGFAPVPPRASPTSIRQNGTSTTLAGWKLSWDQAADAFALRPDGIVTVFPHLAAVAGVRKRLARRDVPIVAWCFNLGRLYAGAKGRLARFGLAAVDRIICHSTHELDVYSRWLGLPRERFSFIPLQRADLAHDDVSEDEQSPFIVAIGSARRDYATFFEAVERLGYRTIVVAAPHAVAGLRVPANVEVRSGLSRDACVRLSQQGRVNVVPIANDQTASGQVTVIQAMRLGKSVVATRCVGTVDYVDDDVTGRLVPPADPVAMASAIRALWEDAASRRRLGEAAGAHARRSFTDAAAGASLARVLDDVWAGRA